MSKILAYGEDAFTLWALKHRTSDILGKFQDKTAPSDCVIFYRPSFGRHRKESSAVFGEFDAIIASSENVYLIESKWDNFGEFKKNQLTLRREQELRHQIFTWYLIHWSKKYSNNWDGFVVEQQSDFQKKFKGKTIAPKGRLLARNLESILTKILGHCKRFSSEDNIKNVLLFFYNSEKSKKPTKLDGTFTLIPIDYSKEIKDNFVTLF